jgi:hypothetical protein
MKNSGPSWFAGGQICVKRLEMYSIVGVSCTHCIAVEMLLIGYF